MSYLPTFINIDELIFGDRKILKINTNIKKEIHVNRPLNVWASGGSHKTYFKYIDLIVLKIFIEIDLYYVREVVRSVI